jgi:hypothetical protein
MKFEIHFEFRASLRKFQDLNFWMLQRRCRTPLNWSEPGERNFFRPDMVNETEDRVHRIIHNLKEAQPELPPYSDFAQCQPRSASLPAPSLHRRPSSPAGAPKLLPSMAMAVESPLCSLSLAMAAVPQTPCSPFRAWPYGELAAGLLGCSLLAPISAPPSVGHPSPWSSLHASLLGVAACSTRFFPLAVELGSTRSCGAWRSYCSLAVTFPLPSPGSRPCSLCPLLVARSFSARALRSVAARSRANSLAAVPYTLSPAARSPGCASLGSVAPSFVWTATTCAKTLLLLLEASRRNI